MSSSRRRKPVSVVAKLLACTPEMETLGSVDNKPAAVKWVDRRPDTSRCPNVREIARDILISIDNDKRKKALTMDLCTRAGRLVTSVGQGMAEYRRKCRYCTNGFSSSLSLSWQEPSVAEGASFGEASLNLGGDESTPG